MHRVNRDHRRRRCSLRSLTGARTATNLLTHLLTQPYDKPGRHSSGGPLKTVVDSSLSPPSLLLAWDTVTTVSQFHNFPTGSIIFEFLSYSPPHCSSSSSSTSAPPRPPYCLEGKARLFSGQVPGAFPTLKLATSGPAFPSNLAMNAPVNPSLPCPPSQ